MVKRKLPASSSSSTLSKTYYDAKNPASFGGVAKLEQATKTKSKKWLSQQMAYSLHKPARKKFPTRKYYSSGLNHVWQMDLMEMIPYARINKGYKYILTCVDVFSRFARALPTKSKKGDEIASVITTMFKKQQVPRKIQTDLGKEFYNTHVQKLFKSRNVEHYSVHSQFKAAICERFNRTLREKMSRYFTHSGKKVWYDVLQKLIDSYNNSSHRGIFKMTPASITKENEMEVWERKQQGNSKVKTTTVKYKLLNYVRVSRTKGPFLKNFDQNWSDEVFRIVGIDTNSSPVMYILQDLDNQVIKGKFYTQELQDIGPHPPQVWRIEKIIRTKGTGVNKQYFVKWHGYDKNSNSWISASQIDK